MSNLAVNDNGDVLSFDGQQWKPATIAQNDQGERLVLDGSDWKPLASIVGKAKGTAQGTTNGLIDTLSGFGDSLAHGVTFGLGDEATAAVHAAFPKLSNWLMSGPSWTPVQGVDVEKPRTTSQAPTFNERYDEELARARAADAQYSKDHPVLSTGGKIAGNVLGTVAAAEMLPFLAPTAGGSLLFNGAKLGAAGATLGGIQGFNEGEGGFSSRLANAVPGAVAGGALGAAAPFVGAGVRQIAETGPAREFIQSYVSPFARKLAGVIEGEAPPVSLSAAAPDGTPGVTGPLTEFANTTQNVAQTGAVQRLATAMQRSGMTKDQVERRLAQLGPEATFADVDNQFMRQARMANTMPGETSSLAESVLAGREKGRPDRLISAFEGGENPPPTFKLMGEGQGFDQNLRATGSRVYDEMDAAGLKQTPGVTKLINDNPYVSKAIDNVLATEKATRLGTDRAPASPVEIMHKVKQAIWDMGFDKDTARPGPMASYFRDLGTEFMDKLKAANPKLAEADKAYAQAASLPDFFAQGYKFLSPGTIEAGMNSSSPALAEALSKANTQQVLATRAGSTNVVRDTVQGRGALAKSLALAKDVENGKEIQARLSQIYEPEQAANIVRQSKAENVFNKTKQDIVGGSQSMNKAAEAADTGNLGVRVTPGGITPRFYERLADVIAKLGAPNEAVRNEIGRATLNMDPNEKARLLARILAEVEKREAGSYAPTFAGSIGGQFSPAGP